MAKAHSDIPVATVSRLALYLRELLQMERGGKQHIQSGQLAQRLGLKDSQVRRDLSCLGQVGQRGVGYPLQDLLIAIQNVLGTDRSWNVILIGIGNLGRALSGYRGFQSHGFQLVAAFDSDRDKVGCTLGSLEVQSLTSLEGFLASHSIDLAILAVPAIAAHSVAKRLEAGGVPGILNFAPIAVPSSETMTVQHVDLAVELQRLAFAVARRKRMEVDKAEDFSPKNA